MESIHESLKPGAIFAGKYRLERFLGEGGFGVVIAATHVLTHDRVALKVMRAGSEESPDLQKRFVNEARAAVQIKSEHVARVTDVDTLPDGGTFIVMEYLDGSDLAAVLARTGRLSVATAVDYLLQACEALAEAHALGIVHRDLKPGNLFLTHRRDGSDLVKVLDFGISKMAPAAGEARLTQTRGAMGSPSYMSPEQMTAPKSVDARSDLWSLGITLFEMLTLRWPFEAPTLEGLIVEMVTKPHTDIRVFRAEVPEGVAEVIDACLQKSPTKRPASVEELAARLAPFGTAAARMSAERISRVLVAASGSSLPALVAAATGSLDDPETLTLHGREAATQLPWSDDDPTGLVAGARRLEGVAATTHEDGETGTIRLPRKAPSPWALAAVGCAVVGAVIVSVAVAVRFTGDSPATTAVPPLGVASLPSAAAPPDSAPTMAREPSVPAIDIAELSPAAPSDGRRRSRGKHAAEPKGASKSGPRSSPGSQPADYGGR